MKIRGYEKLSELRNVKTVKKRSRSILMTDEGRFENRTSRIERIG